MSYAEILASKVISGGKISKDEAMRLYYEPLEEICAKADEIRKHFCADKFDVCTIINGKSGRCSEDCKFCAQSAHHKTNTESYPLLSPDELTEKAKRDFSKGVAHYGIVTSGRNLSDEEVDRVCEAVRKIKAETGISVCVSLGLLTEEQYRKLKEAGVVRVHNNLETSEKFFPKVCTTHKFSDKVKAIKAAQRAGLPICSGGIMGIGESVEDRIDMALSLRELGVKNVPVNMLNPIPGTPLALRQVLGEDELRRIIAVYRFILPDAFIRLAGGRGLLEDMGRECFESGANASISGNMLTTSGFSVESDMKLFDELGFKVEYCDD
ncbi:MAG: biotin synthase BioB [Synergistaceae bacterium]|nr:biotin synthase BioB [Synergistaceae bacterium]MBR0185413.1 biotin synthase BioB [Synergistaceae bacterium]